MSMSAEEQPDALPGSGSGRVETASIRAYFQSVPVFFPESRAEFTE